MLAMRCKVTHGPDITTNNTRGCANKYSISIMESYVQKRKEHENEGGGKFSDKID